MIIDEAHDAKETDETAYQLKLFNVSLVINMTATPCREGLRKLNSHGFSYREEQAIKEIGIAYLDAPCRRSLILDDSGTIFKEIENLVTDNKRNYTNNVGAFTYKALSKDATPVEIALMSRVIESCINAIYSTQFDNKAKQLGKKITVGIKGWVNRLSSGTIKASFPKLFELTKSDMRKCMDTIIVVQNTFAANALCERMKKIDSVNKLFDISTDHSNLPAADRRYVIGLELLTSELGDKPRIIILCGVGLQGATYNSVNHVINLSSPRSDARYRQAMARGGTYSMKKPIYYISDFDSELLNKVEVDVDGSYGTISGGGSKNLDNITNLFSDTDIPLSDDGFVQRINDTYNNISDITEMTRYTSNEKIYSSDNSIFASDLVKLLRNQNVNI